MIYNNDISGIKKYLESVTPREILFDEPFLFTAWYESKWKILDLFLQFYMRNKMMIEGNGIYDKYINRIRMRNIKKLYDF